MWNFKVFKYGMKLNKTIRKKWVNPESVRDVSVKNLFCQSLLNKFQYK